ncbi:hypothetical protein BDY19DRAFT_354904 [Irpex rosettiformis]|uniref:Uncharacterized protein n=1 Tax=Irpex rosettiformis TaxID=378272 RepID=A0ACB8TWC4_9APHY|nr:hypothetical protein BDY19DRAFT_354904 [Irpex rosettiformis]
MNGGPQPISISSSAPEPGESRQSRHGDLLTYDKSFRSTTTIDSNSNASSITITSRTPLVSSPSTDSQASSLDYPSQPPVTPISPSTPSEYMQLRKSLVNTVAAAEGTGFAFDKANGVWSKTISCAWPASRSHWKWGMGETMRGSLGAVSFWVRVKVIVTSSSGTESIELTPSEILVVPTNDAERRQATARYAEARASSKARSSNSRNGEPAGSSRETSAAEPERPRSPSEIAYFRYAPPKSAEVSSSARASMSSKKHPLPSTPTDASSSTAQSGSTSSGKTALSTFSKVLPSKKKSRRPHTSAGPRDGADIPMGLGIPIPVPVSTPAKSAFSNGYLSSSSSSSADTPPSIISNRHKRRSSSGKHFLRLNGIGGPGAMALVWNQHQQRLDVERWEREQARERDAQSRELVKAWEEELAQVEKASSKRRESSSGGGSNMLGFLGALGRRRAKAGAS